MEERVEEVLRRYELDIVRSYRIRGSYILETKQGIYIYKSYSGSENRASQEAAIQECLLQRGFELIDCYLANSSGNFLSYDSMGEAHVVKRWYMGEECDLHEEEECFQVAERLAQLHLAMQGMRDELPFEVRARELHPEEIMRRHQRELQRIKTYIRTKKERNSYELLFLQCIDRIYAQGEEAFCFLQETEPQKLIEQAESKGDFLHGSYTYHNLIMNPDGIAVVQFERSWLGWQLMDLYYVLRKTLEKNEWRLKAGEQVLQGYERVRALTPKERSALYGLLWFPEKFWKIANAYYNGKKTRVPGKNLVKLNEYLRQEPMRDFFLRESKTSLFQ